MKKVLRCATSYVLFVLLVTQKSHYLRTSQNEGTWRSSIATHEMRVGPLSVDQVEARFGEKI